MKTTKLERFHRALREDNYCPIHDMTKLGRWTSSGVYESFCVVCFTERDDNSEEETEAMYQCISGELWGDD